MTIEIVDLPIKNGGSFHSYVSLPGRVTNVTVLVPLGGNVVAGQCTAICCGSGCLETREERLG